MTDSEHLIRQLVERIRALKAARAAIGQDIREVYAEAKAHGLDVKTLRRLVERLDMEPSARAEADALLETYEAVLGMDAAAAEAAMAETRPDAAAIALNLLTAEIVALEDPAQASALVEHVLFLLDLRAEIALLRAQERDRKALAKGEGFEVKQLALVVRWFEKCAKHGEDAMRAGEAVFGLYRGTVDAHRPAPVSARDAALMDKFAGGGPSANKVDAKERKRRNMMAGIEAMDAAVRGGGRG